jgi:hypothetical protein
MSLELPAYEYALVLINDEGPLPRGLIARVEDRDHVKKMEHAVLRE